MNAATSHCRWKSAKVVADGQWLVAVRTWIIDAFVETAIAQELVTSAFVTRCYGVERCRRGLPMQNKSNYRLNIG